MLHAGRASPLPPRPSRQFSLIRPRGHESHIQIWRGCVGRGRRRSQSFSMLTRMQTLCEERGKRLGGVRDSKVFNCGLRVPADRSIHGNVRAGFGIFLGCWLIYPDHLVNCCTARSSRCPMSPSMRRLSVVERKGVCRMRSSTGASVS